MKPSIFPPGAEPIIRQFYPDIAAIQEALRAIRPEGIPTEEQLRTKAQKTGIARMAAAPAFSEAEDRVIDRLYPDVEACMRELEGRSKREIQRRAWHLKKTRAGAPFSQEEDATLRRLFPDVTAIQAEMPTRSRNAISSRARKLSLTERIGKHQRYTQAQRRLIRIFYPRYDLLTALLAPRTREAIRFAAREMGLTAGRVGCSRGGHTEAWAETKIAKLTAYGAKLTGRSRSAIQSARRRFGVQVDPETEIARRKANNAARREAAQARAAKRKAEAAARADALKRQNAIWAAERLQRIEAERAEKAEALKLERAMARLERATAVREAKAQRAQERAKAPVVRTAPKPRPVALRTAPKPVPTPRIDRPAPASAPRPTGSGIDPRVLSAAGRSAYGIELVATVQRTVPRDLWPHVKPRVIEDLTMAVVEGRCAPDALSEMLPGVIQAAMRNQFQGAGR